ncbi:MAG: AI-2E family transporter [Pelosinus sp.]|nr:AI-2E family transporter [Pelosinus sp.]
MIGIRSSTWTLAAFIAGIILIFSLARVLAIVLFVATLLSILLYPVVDMLTKRFSRGAAAAMVLVAFIGVLLAGFTWIVSNIVPGFTKLAREIPDFMVRLSSLQDQIAVPPEAAGYVDHALRDAANTAMGIAKKSAEGFLEAVSSAVELIAIPVITFYFLRDGARLMQYFVSFLSKTEAVRLTVILDEIKVMLRKFLQGQGLISLLSGLIVCCYFFIMGLPYGLVFGAISAVAELAPVVGPAVASILAAVLAYAYSPLLAVKTLIFYIIMLKINHNLVYPTLIGKATKLHPVAIVAGVLFLGHIFGVLGMILAVPVLAAIKIIFEHYARGKRDKFE